MKKLLLAVLMLSAFACSKVPSGHVGVKVYLLGGEKGVDMQVLGVGRYWIGFNEELYLFPTYQQNYTWTKDPIEGDSSDESITFQDKDGTQINADFGVSYSIDPEKVAVLFQKYRKGVDEITDLYLRNIVRDAINKVSSTMNVSELYGEKKTEFITSVEKSVREQVIDVGIIVEKISLIGSMRLPQAIVDSLNAKIQATQIAIQTQNEVLTAKAQAEKAIAIAKGDAEANRIKLQSLTPELIRYEAIKKWDGKLPTVTSGAIPMINITQ